MGVGGDDSWGAQTHPEYLIPVDQKLEFTFTFQAFEIKGDFHETEYKFWKILHGGDYNPEQWLEYPEILEQDLAYFKKAKINEVSLGIFSWAFLEPEEGVFDLEWLKKMVDRLYENGISVMMATPTAARPRWMAEKYPEVLRVNAAGERNLYGSAIITAIPHRFTGKKRESSIRSWRKCSKITLA